MSENQPEKEEVEIENEPENTPEKPEVITVSGGIRLPKLGAGNG